MVYTYQKSDEDDGYLVGYIKLNSYKEEVFIYTGWFWTEQDSQEYVDWKNSNE